MQLFLQVLAFLITNRAQIVELIKGIESLIPDAPGSEKCAAVKGAIAQTLSIEQKIDAAWPMVQPIFNLLVSEVKGAK